jgi:hypothetical protein
VGEGTDYYSRNEQGAISLDDANNKKAVERCYEQLATIPINLKIWIKCIKYRKITTYYNRKRNSLNSPPPIKAIESAIKIPPKKTSVLDGFHQ